jgi:hypothetical protein
MLLDSPLVQVGIGLCVGVYLLSQGIQGTQSIAKWRRRRNGDTSDQDLSHSIGDLVADRVEERRSAAAGVRIAADDRELMRVMITEIREERLVLRELVAEVKDLCGRLAECPARARKGEE